jgi:23S rRNA (guanosine2251-2'-O)-methyltransferase
MQKLSMDQLNRLSPDEFKSTKKFPLVILLDNVRSLNNVGSAFRTADAFAIEKIILCGITGTPPNREITKTALGSTDSVTWEYEKDGVAAVERLIKEGYEIISFEQVSNSVKLNQFNPAEGKKYCFVFGNEVHGVQQEIISRSAFCIEIPQFGTKHSLNISVSIGIGLWDFVYKRLNQTQHRHEGKE